MKKNSMSEIWNTNNTVSKITKRIFDEWIFHQSPSPDNKFTTDSSECRVINTGSCFQNWKNLNFFLTSEWPQITGKPLSHIAIIMVLKFFQENSSLLKKRYNFFYLIICGVVSRIVWIIELFYFLSARTSKTVNFAHSFGRNIKKKK